METVNEDLQKGQWLDYLASEYPEASQEELEAMLVDFDPASDLQVVRFKDEHGTDLFVHTLVTLDPELNKAMYEFGFDFEDDYRSDDNPETIVAGLNKLKNLKRLLQDADNRARLIDLANSHKFAALRVNQVKDQIDRLLEDYKDEEAQNLVMHGEAAYEVEQDIHRQLKELLTGEYKKSN